MLHQNTFIKKNKKKKTKTKQKQNILKILTNGANGSV